MQFDTIAASGTAVGNVCFIGHERSHLRDIGITDAIMNPAKKQKARILGRGPLGFSRKTWPFVKVLFANSAFGLVFYVCAKLVFHWQPQAWEVADRLTLVIKCSVFAILPAVVAITIVAAQRLNPDLWIGQKVRSNSSLDINTRFVLNTVEQFILLLVGLSGISLYVPVSEARTVPILAALFLMGRILFWVGYHKNPYLRAFGFGLTFYPTVVVFTWLIVRIVFGIYIPI